jgi:gliding motility-associated-like protein
VIWTVIFGLLLSCICPWVNEGWSQSWELEILMVEAMRRRILRSLGVAIVALLPGWLSATTTSGATVRNVNTADGIVTLGAAPGANGAAWETDEVFQGFSGDVNWYLTWDDNNVYLGRIGGNNAEGSVIYIRAEYPGSVYDTRAFNYDNLQPETSRMGGINFAAYLKDSYHEYRTYNGAWSAATAGTLNPAFTTQGVFSHFEVTIPWSAITGGNGRPSNVRLALYQVAPNAGAPACTPVNHFVYGESPWGTGDSLNLVDGPRVGVNDGVPTSQRQPGGCGVGADTLTRWWGCYPVIGGVGSNGWIAALPNAGPDDSICQTATAYPLSANMPPATAVGTWSVASQPSGAAATFTAPNNPNAFAQNLSVMGTYFFVWDINYGGCPSQPDTIVITRIPNAAVALAMADTVMGCLRDTLTLRANGPGNGSGLWSLVAGTGTFATPNDTTTVVYGLSNGTNQFQYTISNGICPATSDLVTVYQPIPVPANGGPDLEVCEISQAVMAADDPVLVQGSAIGRWTEISGPTNVVFSNLLSNTSNVSNMVTGSYQLLWTVTNYNCPVETDTVLVTNYQGVFADAGGDQIHCLGDPVTLDGNDISALGAGTSSMWTQLSGPNVAVITNAQQYNTTVTNLIDGQYLFSWRVANGVCPPDSQNMYLTMVDLQNNGIFNTVVPDSAQSNGTIIVAQPVNGSNPYLYSSDGLNFGGSNVFDSLASGNYAFYIMDANGCSDSLSYFLPYIPPTPDTMVVVHTIKVPTGFSPNADSNNDTWEIPGIAFFPNAEIEVFNIWGGMVFRSAGAYTPWNGQRNGQDLPSANYYFVIDLKTEGQPLLKGSLTILR